MSETAYKTFEKEIEEKDSEDNIEDNTKGFWKCENKLNKIDPKYTISVACATWGFLTGVERAIILPTLWLYFVTKFGSETAKSYYGATLAAFNLAVFIFAPFYGYLAYKGFRTKALLVISNQMEIVGNIIYFVASEPWLIMLGRFIAGIGSGSEVPLYADVVRVTKPEERTTYIVILLLARQVGLIIGPAATLILHPVKFRIGTIDLNIYNSPGFLMAILWSIQTIQVLISYPDITKSGEPLKPDNNEKRNLNDIIIDQIYDVKTTNESEKERLTGRRGSNIVQKIKSSLSNLNAYTNYNTLTLLVIVFTSYFCLISMEAVIPPITIRYFQWTEVHNSYLYLIAGILVIVIYAVLQNVSQFIKDRTILLFGLIFLMISYIWMTFTLGFVNSEQKLMFIILMSLSAFFHIFGLSLVIACGESLFTKTLPPEEMDMAQSVLRTTINFSLLVGPYISGSLQFYPYIVYIILFILVTVSSILMVTKYALFDI